MKQKFENIPIIYELKLQTIQENNSQQQQTIDRKVQKSYMKNNNNKRKVSQSEKKYTKMDCNGDVYEKDIKNITQMQNRRMSFSQEYKQTISSKKCYDPFEGSNKTRHRRNKTQTQKNHKPNYKNPVSTCLFVPFLQSSEVKIYALQRKYKLDIPDQSSNRINLKSIRQEQNSDVSNSYRQKGVKNINTRKGKIELMNDNQHNRYKTYSLPAINKSVKLQKKAKQYQKDKEKSQFTQKKASITKRQHNLKLQLSPKNQTTLNNKNIFLEQNKRILFDQRIKISNQNKKNIKQFKIQNRQKKIDTKKKIKILQQWKQINYLQLRTCYYQIQKKLQENNSQEEIKISKTQSYNQNRVSGIPKGSITSNDLSSKTVQFKNQSKKLDKLASIPKAPKLPSKRQNIAQIIKNYQSLGNKKINLNQMIKSKSFFINFIQNQMLYFGQSKKQIPHGYGVIIQKNYLFQGQWNQGNKIFGFQIKKDTSYEGKFQNNKRQGFGNYFWNNGEDQYSGQWKNGEKHGNGVWKNTKGDQYIGQWINGSVQGYGVHSTIDGQKYQGYFVKFLKQGKGKQIFPNGDIYEGFFSGGKPEGQGVYKFKKSKAVYQGPFNKGFRNGKGKLTVPNVLRYEGQFKNDQITGAGKLYLNNQNSYIGSFKDGKYDGMGSFHLFKQSKTFYGLWKNGVFYDKKQQNMH